MFAVTIDEDGLCTALRRQSCVTDMIRFYTTPFDLACRRRPFLIKGLEATLNKLVLSLEFYDELGRKKIAIATALVFQQKLGALPENVLPKLLNDRLVAKGTVLDFVTTFFQVMQRLSLWCVDGLAYRAVTLQRNDICSVWMGLPTMNHPAR